MATSMEQLHTWEEALENPKRETEKKLLSWLQKRCVALYETVKAEQFSWCAASAIEQCNRKSVDGEHLKSHQPWSKAEATAMYGATCVYGLSRPELLHADVKKVEWPQGKHESGDVIDALACLLSRCIAYVSDACGFFHDDHLLSWASDKLSTFCSVSDISEPCRAIALPFGQDNSLHPLVAVEVLKESMEPKSWLHRMRLLDRLEHLLADPDMNILDRETQQAFGEIRDFTLPPWWSPRCDFALLAGVHKHGFGNYSSIREDPELAEEFNASNQWADQTNSSSWPADEVLVSRLQRAVDVLYKAKERKEVHNARVEEKRRKEEEKSQSWSKKERQELLRALMQHGVPRTEIGGTVSDWTALKRHANLPKKWETTIEVAYHELFDEMKRLVQAGGATADHKEGCRCVACVSKRNAKHKRSKKKPEELVGPEEDSNEDEEVYEEMDDDNADADAPSAAGNDDAPNVDGTREVEGDMDFGEDKRRQEMSDLKEEPQEHEQASSTRQEGKQQKHEQQQESAPLVLTAKTACSLRDRLHALDTLHWAYRSFKSNWSKRLGLQVSRREELPRWWTPNKHDRELVFATLCYGYCNWQRMRNDKSLTFLRGGVDAVEETEFAYDDPNTLDPPPPSKVLSKRLRTLVSFFKRYGAKHGKRKKDATDLPSRHLATANKARHDGSEQSNTVSLGPRRMPSYKVHTDEELIREHYRRHSESFDQYPNYSNKRKRHGGADDGQNANVHGNNDEKVSKWLQHVTFDENGEPTMPVKLTAKMTLESLGKIDATRSAFHSDRRVFPIGYCIVREHTNMVDPDAGTATYRMMIADQNNQPVFRIICNACPDVIIERNSATGAWGEVSNRINDKRGLPRGKSTASGIDMFGLSHPTVEELLKRQENYDKLFKLHGLPNPNAMPNLQAGHAQQQYAINNTYIPGHAIQVMHPEHHHQQQQWQSGYDVRTAQIASVQSPQLMNHQQAQGQAFPEFGSQEHALSLVQIAQFQQQQQQQQHHHHHHHNKTTQQQQVMQPQTMQNLAVAMPQLEQDDEEENEDDDDDDSDDDEHNEYQQQTMELGVHKESGK